MGGGTYVTHCQKTIGVNIDGGGDKEPIQQWHRDQPVLVCT